MNSFGAGIKSFLLPPGIIGWVTFREILRDRVLYNSLIFAVLLLALGYLAAGLSFSRPYRIVLDFGLASVGIVNTLISLFMGATLIGKEFEKRTFFVAMSKPISRFQFVIGKYFGLSGVITLNWIILSLVFVFVLKLTGGEMSSVLVWALVLILLQCLLAGVISVALSSFSTATLASIMTIGIYMVGANISQFRIVVVKMSDSFVKSFLAFGISLFPNFEHFHLGTKVDYGIPIAASAGFYSIGYAFVWIMMFLILAGILIQRRES